MQEISVIHINNINSFAPVSLPLPTAGPDDVVVKVMQCGICGSDLSYVAMGGLLGPGRPMALGHELSAVVSAVGANVRSVKVGDRVVVNPMGSGNQIGNGGPEGGFAPYLLVRNAALVADAVFPLPDGLSDEVGALVEPLSVSMHGVHQSELKAGEKLVIFGAGPIGLGIVLVARYLGITNIVVVDLSASRLKIARQLGATPFQADSGDVGEFLKQQHGSSETLGQQMPASDVYIEATGVGAVLEQIINLAGGGARVTVVGVHKAPIQLDPVTLLVKELRITGSMAYPDEFPQVLDMLASGKVDPTPLISHRFPLAEFDAAFAAAKDQHSAVKVLVDCQAI